ncbi:hypothetical protein Q5762_38485, partial [Streptomyces sp. P9(2023)]|uniref:hypothetical protein n=1 Tax=Streptomyces sp. P9(2023) TaxID=3064394 RepID=UPI0028F42E5D
MICKRFLLSLMVLSCLMLSCGEALAVVKKSAEEKTNLEHAVQIFLHNEPIHRLLRDAVRVRYA